MSIIKGHKGIIDLDLTNVPEIYHSLLIKQHENDIANYEMNQQKLPVEMRYENTIGKVLEKKDFYDKLRDKKVNELKQEEEIKFMNMIQRHYNSDFN